MVVLLLFIVKVKKLSAEGTAVIGRNTSQHRGSLPGQFVQFLWKSGVVKLLNQQIIPGKNFIYTLVFVEGQLLTVQIRNRFHSLFPDE